MEMELPSWRRALGLVLLAAFSSTFFWTMVFCIGYLWAMGILAGAVVLVAVIFAIIWLLTYDGY